MELIVALGIVVALSAILLPSFAAAREHGRQAACMSNLRQLGLAMQMYVQDNDEFFPASAPVSRVGETGWVAPGRIAAKTPANVERGSIWPYVKSASTYICPDDPMGSAKKLSYGMNMWIGCPDACDDYGPAKNYGSGVSMDKVYNPSMVILLVDEQGKLKSGNFDPVLDFPTTIHNGGTVLVCCDDHVVWSVPSQILVHFSYHPGTTKCPCRI